MIDIDKDVTISIKPDTTYRYEVRAGGGGLCLVYLENVNGKKSEVSIYFGGHEEMMAVAEAIRQAANYAKVMV